MTCHISRSQPLFVASAILLVFSLLGGCSSKFVKSGGEASPQDMVRISSEGVVAGEPAIAADHAGNVFVVWVEHTSDKGADVLVRKFGSAAKPSGEIVRVNPMPGLATAWRGDPPTLSIGKNNTIYIGWTRRYGEKEAKGNDLVLSVSSDGGQTFAEPVKVNDDTKPASHGMHSLAVDETGRVHMAWLDERNRVKNHNQTATSMSLMHHEEAEPNSEVYYAESGDGGKTFAANRKLATEVCPCCKTSMLVSPDGTIYAAWRQVLPGDLRHIAVSHSTDGGKTFSEGVVVSDDKWQINACPVSGAALAVDKTSKLLVAWYTAGKAGQPGLYLSESSDGGKTFAPRRLISFEMTGGTPVLPASHGETSSVVFTGTNNDVVTSGLADQRGTPPKNSKLADDASLPASVSFGGRRSTAFVRNVGDDSAVWLTFEK